MDKLSENRNTVVSENTLGKMHTAVPDVPALLAEALKPGASYSRVAQALEALLELTANGLAGDATAYAQ